MAAGSLRPHIVRVMAEHRERPMDLALVREYLEPEEVYEKRPPRGRRSGPGCRFTASLTQGFTESLTHPGSVVN